jgi:hypothetical protein
LNDFGAFLCNDPNKKQRVFARKFTLKNKHDIDEAIPAGINDDMWRTGFCAVINPDGISKENTNIDVKKTYIQHVISLNE